jgi:hypothetical protein
MKRADPPVFSMHACLTTWHDESVDLERGYVSELACCPGIRASCTTGLQNSHSHYEPRFKMRSKSLKMIRDANENVQRHLTL